MEIPSEFGKTGLSFVNKAFKALESFLTITVLREENYPKDRIPEYYTSMTSRNNFKGLSTLQT